MKEPIQHLRDSVLQALKILEYPEVDVHFEKPKDPSHGDIATNVAFLLAKPARKSPRDIAGSISEKLSLDSDIISFHSVASAGFINFVFAPAYLQDVGRWILEKGVAFADSQDLTGERILLEFVSANPSGPLNVVSARAAAVGDSLHRIFEARGARVDSEYYVNDSGNQVRLLGESVRARYETLLGNATDVPENGYHGEYLIDLARDIIEQDGDTYHALPAEKASDKLGQKAIEFHVGQHAQVLTHFRVSFSQWFRESSLHQDNSPQVALNRMNEVGAVYEEDGATYLRTEDFGDNKNWVVKTSDGRWTYFLPDIAYHVNKFERGYTKLIDILGPDHHTFPSKMGAAMHILKLPAENLHVIILQQVNLLRDGVAVKMSKRAGEIVEMKELLDEVGVDAARYFFVLRRTTTPLDFDIELAKLHSEENPVYYVQYAHARIASIFRKGQFEPPNASVNLNPLEHPEELNLLRRLRELPEVIEEAGRVMDPHGITTWLREVATQFHRFYHHCRVLGEQPDLQSARLALCRATQIALARGLDLLGVNAPDAM
ncbi:arginine--tRNA ligase [bacterium]|nr:arginine--tRNA ligase [bacterium]MBU1937225.1 arginine--tRNA ligase [bacterium]